MPVYLILVEISLFQICLDLIDLNHVVSMHEQTMLDGSINSYMTGN